MRAGKLESYCIQVRIITYDMIVLQNIIHTIQHVAKTQSSKYFELKHPLMQSLLTLENSHLEIQG